MLSDLLWRLRALFRRAAVERELDEELRFHLEHEIEKNVRAGVPIDEARRRARLAFGGLERIKDDARDARGLIWLDACAHDLRYAARGIRRRPGFAMAVVLTLGLGLGANIAMFGIVDRLLFRPPAFLRDPAGTHRVYFADRNAVTSNTSYTRYRDLARWSSAFSTTAAFEVRRLAVGTGEDTRIMRVAVVSASYFALFDARPALGRFFTAREDSVGAAVPVVVIGWALWQTRYGGRADVIGQALQVGSLSCTIVGVAAPTFLGVDSDKPAVAFIPINAFGPTIAADLGREPSAYYTKYYWNWVEILVRHKPGMSPLAATADLNAAFRRSLEAAHATTPGGARALIEPIQKDRGPRSSGVSQVALWTSGVACIVLLIACANIANLFLARGLAARREIALRFALGSSRTRIGTRLVTELVLFAGAATIVGCIIAQGGDAILRALFLPASPGKSILDPRTLAFAAAAAVTASALTSLAPVMHAARGDLADTIKDGARESRRRGPRLRAALLVVQGTLSVVLLVGAGLFVRSLHNVRALRLGYDIDPVLYVQITWRGVTLPDTDQVALTHRLLDEARAMPGVTRAGLGLTVPFWNTWSEDLFTLHKDSVPHPERFTMQAATPEYFRTVGTRIVRGRGFTDADRAGAPPVIIVTDAFGAALWPGQDAIGQCLRVAADTMPCATVVGIAEPIKQTSLVEDRGMQVYLPIDQSLRSGGTTTRKWYHVDEAQLFVRVDGDASRYAESLRRRLQRLMPGASFVSVFPMHDIIDENTVSWRLGATMFVALGCLALVLAAVGLYSVIAYGVAQRTRELGVRMALGARAMQVVWLVVGDGVRFAAAGLLLGGALALAGGRLIEPLLFGERVSDPLVLGAVTGVLLVTALAASFIPALRATRVSPSIALRTD